MINRYSTIQTHTLFILLLLLFNRVLMLGDTAVGKSSLVSQFMTSEYLHAYDTSIGEFHFCAQYL